MSKVSARQTVNAMFVNYGWQDGPVKRDACRRFLAEGITAKVDPDGFVHFQPEGQPSKAFNYERDIAKIERYIITRIEPTDMEPATFPIVRNGRTSIDIEYKQPGSYELTVYDIASHSKTGIALNRENLIAVKDQITKLLDITALPCPVCQALDHRLLPEFTQVRTVDRNLSGNGWSSGASVKRRFGVYGNVVKYSNEGHGAYYTVRHADDDSLGYYDPCELVEIN